MTLGEKISSLRNGEGMSQGDLAEKLNVSRQSVSKWETNASIPDLDKLIQLSDLFNLTLDELVRGEELYSKTKESSVSDTTESQPQIIIQKNISTQKIIGFILLGFGLMCCLLALFFGRGLLVVGGYLILCSVFCLVLKKNAALIIGWITVIIVFCVIQYITGLKILGVFLPSYFIAGFSTGKAAVNAGGYIIELTLWALVAVLVFFTVRAVYKKIRK